MNELIGKWQQPEGQPYPGLWFEFKPDGTFKAEYPEMGIVSTGTYAIEGGNIALDQTQHTLGFIGKFLGLWKVENDTLKMAVGQLPGQLPADLSAARTYKRIG